MIESIEQVTEEAVIVIVNDEQTAKDVLKKNARCQVEKQTDGDEDRYALIYNIKDCNLLNAIKRG